MSHDDEAERDTLPPEPDPIGDAIARVEGKIDTLTGMVRAFFEELQEQKSRGSDHEERLSFLERKNANGANPV